MWRVLVVASVTACGFERGSLATRDGSRDDVALPADCPEVTVDTLALYRFDADAGNVIEDATGNFSGARVGTHTAYEPSPCGMALRFMDPASTPSSWGTIPDDDAWDLPMGSIAIAFKVDAIGGAQGILSRDETGQTEAGHLSIGVSSTGRVGVRFQQLSSGAAAACSDAPIAADRWTTIVLNVSNPIQLFIDGVEQMGTGRDPIFAGIDCGTGTGPPSLDNSLPWTLGVSAATSQNGTSGLAQPMHGVIDHVRISSTRAQ